VTEIDALLEALPEEREFIRPHQKVAPSSSDGVLKQSGSRQPAAKVDDGEKYARKGGFFGWLKRLFGA
jgi:hypothetical protein